MAEKLTQDTGVAVELYQLRDFVVLDTQNGRLLARFPLRSFTTPGLYELLHECVENHRRAVEAYEDFKQASFKINYWKWVLDTTPERIHALNEEHSAIAVRVRDLCGPTQDEEISELKERVAVLEGECKSAEITIANVVASLIPGSPTTN